MPRLFIFDTDDTCRDSTPEHAGIARAVLKDTLVPEVEALQELDRRIGVPGNWFTGSVDRFLARDSFEMTVVEHQDRCSSQRSQPVRRPSRQPSEPFHGGRMQSRS